MCTYLISDLLQGYFLANVICQNVLTLPEINRYIYPLLAE